MFGKALLGANGTSGGGTPPPVDLTQGLVSHFLLNNNADDIVGTYDGTPFNGVDFQGDVAKFDGVDDYITTEYPLTQNQVRTYSFWYRPTVSQDTNIRVCFGFGPLVFSASHSNFDYSGALAIRDNLDVWRSTGHYTLTIGTLYNIVCVINNTTAKLYINSVNAGNTITFSGQYSTKATEYYRNKLDLGASRNASLVYTSLLNGTMSNFRVYNEAKDQTFIDALYAEGYYPKPLPKPTTDGLIAHYPLTGTAEDAWGAGGNETGTEYNGVTFVTDVDRGSVALFDGVNDYIGIPVAFNTTAYVDKPFTTSIRYKRNGIAGVGALATGDKHPLISSGLIADTDINFILMVDMDNNEVHVQVATNIVSHRLYGKAITIPIDLSVGYHHYVLTYDGSEINTGFTLHIDDTEYAFTDWSLTSGSYSGMSTDTLLLGGFIPNDPNYKRFSNGRMSDVRIYNRVLTTVETTALYNEVNEPTDGLVAHYPLTLEARALDMWASYNGTETGITYVDNAEYGSVIDYGGGSTQYVPIPSLLFPTSLIEFSIGCWFRTDDTAKSGQRIMYLNNGTDVSYGFINLSPTSISFNQLFGGTTETAPYTFTPTTGWYHVFVTLTKTSGFKMYLNGVLVSTGTVPWNITNAMKLWLGADRTGNNFTSLNGSMRNARVYFKELVQQEITDIYNYEKNFRPIDIDDGLVAYYPLANNSLDNYKNQYDGVDTSMTYDGLSGVFNGSTSLNSIGLNIAAFKTQTLSMCGWVKPNSIGTLQYIQNNHVRSDTSGSSLNGGCGFRLQTNGKIAGVYVMLNNETVVDSNGNSNGNTPLAYCIGTTILSINQWYHVAFIVDNNKGYLFINGILEATVTSVQNMRYSSGNNYYSLGAVKTDISTSLYFNGRHAKSRHFNKLITKEQLEVIYNTEKGDFGL